MQAWRHLLCCTKRRGKEPFFTTETQRHREKQDQKVKKTLGGGPNFAAGKGRFVTELDMNPGLKSRWIHLLRRNGGGPCVWWRFPRQERSWREIRGRSPSSGRRSRCISSLA